MTFDLETLIDSRLVLSRDERVAMLKAHGHQQLAEITPELWRLVRARRMDVVCPDCKASQAAGHYCYRCYLPLFISDWFDRHVLASARARASMSPKTRAAFAKARERAAARRRAKPVRYSA